MFGKKRMKVLSISQLAMAAIFLTIGMVDRYKVGYKTSLTYMPCWISSLVLATGTMGLAVIRAPIPSSILIDALWSVSVACIVLSAIAVYSYHRGLIHCLINTYRWENYDFVVEGTTTFLTDKEKLMVAISSLLVAFFILEIMLAATLVRSTTLASLQPPSEHELHCIHPPRGRSNTIQSECES
ncbi:unnamed protein product [Pocillopora meandrina]|uniref:MARVEL domain-containing protein n=1 Tax=Pocillopora meandrina TaxID=46732 RepID=A0AAU9XTD2_9CNID|nr:unnamed protein product [Pocillopora meandrina]